MGRSVVVERRLAPEAGSVAEARRLLRGAVTEAELAHGEWLDNALLAASEIVTNALVHAGTSIGLTIRVDGSAIRVEVADGSRHLPMPRGYAVTAGTGRGLSLVDDLVHAWGSRPADGGKVVWFELAADDLPPAAADGPPRRRPAGASAGAADDPVEVVLLEVPLLTHAAWQEHAASLLREYLLAQLDDDGADGAVFEAHAAASDAMAILFEQIPVPDLGGHPEALMDSAIEPGVTSPRVLLRMPAETSAHFDLLEGLLEAAIGDAATGAWLNAPTQPEIQELRGWLCGQVRGQREGGVPVPWQVADHQELPPPTPLADWDASVVTRSELALLTADDTDRIVAVSPGALLLLGYDDPEQLVGQRLLTIIPRRFHQAHLAGFTLHLINGRAPLLNRSVTVPVLRRDDSERLVGLTVTPVQLPHGRHLFTAELASPPPPS